MIVFNLIGLYAMVMGDPGFGILSFVMVLFVYHTFTKLNRLTAQSKSDPDSEG